MIRQPVAVMVVAAVLASVAGCKSSGEPAMNGPVQAGTVPRLVPQRPFPIDDLPIPVGFKLDGDRSVNSDFPGGMRFVDHLYKGGGDKVAVRTFYEDQMPEYGWRLVENHLIRGTFFLTFVKERERCDISVGDGDWFHRVYVKARIARSVPAHGTAGVRKKPSTGQ